ncbi:MULTISPECIES: VWA domain-containing protein [unclassified Bacillus (in: firmicutes)]|uniref:VWA domain-containing protein n=1 Tax=unclassified Bacillus (in: firmicutes) TaxID=185979 RepID=UPI0008EAAB65|nr:MULTISPECIES: VWA domain-containing protein [unclassified Bacillus (in: firmicutes)]SFA69792.1 Stress response protein SCP2 [Bacillus sp. UNCCL13]SFQ59164.1 Stress response protein SCP2 [Bacillus sp. cl95]
MKTLIRGEKVKLSDFTQASLLQVEVKVQSNLEVDITCFGLNDEKKLVDDRYMIFYNQTVSPAQEVKLLSHQSGSGVFTIDTSKLPASINHLVFTATIDGQGTMSSINSGTITLSANGLNLFQYIFTGLDFQNEKAIIISEIYHKTIWRASAVGKGFDGGLAALLKHFGGVVAEEQPTPTVAPVSQTPSVAPHAPVINQKKINLEKKMEQKAPKILDLSKKAKVSLEKVGLQNHNAKVALCLDISGSMYNLYKSGKIQEFAERILALGTRFDDDGSIDIFLFGQNAHYAGDLSIDNFNGFVGRTIQKYPLEGATYYGKVMKEIREHYFGSAAKRLKPLARPLPVYVMFVTDGATFDENTTIAHIQNSSYEPIFWQFMAIGKSNKDVKKRRGLFQSLFQSDFTFLEELDQLSGRYLDNANFFSVEDPRSTPDAELYDLLMEEYPGWVKQANAKGLIQPSPVRTY